MEVYKIINTVNDKLYIGQTSYTAAERWTQHYKMAQYGIKDQPLHHAIAKYGKDSFICETIASAIGQTYEEKINNLNALETILIEQWDVISPKGYNLKSRGDGRGKHHPDTLRKIGAYHKGKVIPQEMRERIRQTLTGYKHTKEALANMKSAVACRIGVPRNQKIRDKIGSKQIGKVSGPLSYESKNKISNSLKGRKRIFTAQHRQALRERKNTKFGIVGIKIDGTEIIFLKKPTADHTFDYTCISKCCANKRHSHKGYFWMNREQLPLFLSLCNFLFQKTLGA